MGYISLRRRRNFFAAIVSGSSLLWTFYYYYTTKFPIKGSNSSACHGSQAQSKLFSQTFWRGNVHLSSFYSHCKILTTSSSCKLKQLIECTFNGKDKNLLLEITFQPRTFQPQTFEPFRLKVLFQFARRWGC